VGGRRIDPRDSTEGRGQVPADVRGRKERRRCQSQTTKQEERGCFLRLGGGTVQHARGGANQGLKSYY